MHFFLEVSWIKHIVKDIVPSSSYTLRPQVRPQIKKRRRRKKEKRERGGREKKKESIGPSLEDVKVLAVLELAVLFAEQPRQHLSGLHARSNHTPRLVPVAATLAGSVSTPILRHVAAVLQADLVQDTDQQMVHVVVDPDRDLDELHPIGARHALAICITRKRIRERR